MRARVHLGTVNRTGGIGGRQEDRAASEPRGGAGNGPPQLAP